MEFYSNSPIQERIRRQSPMLWFALPFAMGIAFAEILSSFGEFAAFYFVSAVLLAALCGTFMLYDKSAAAKTAFAIMVFFGSSFYYGEKVPPNPYPEWNTRETMLTLYVERADTNAKGATYGFARIAGSSEYFENAKGLKIWYYTSNPDISRGDTISGRFTLRKVEDKEGFDAYLHSQKIYFNASAQGKTEVSKGGFPYTFYNKARDYISRNLSLLPEAESPNTSGAKAYRAMILGDKSLLETTAKEGFAATGTMHIFAISGLHVGLIAASIYGILNLLRLPRKSRPLICLPILFLYVNACGARPSAMRAFLMIALIWVAISLVRKPKPFAGFVAAFALSLILRPSDLFDAGFALSYAVVAAILLYAVPFMDEIKQTLYSPIYIESRIVKFRRKFTDYLIAAFAISFAAIFASAPLSSAYFGYIAPLALPFSIVYVAAASIVVTLGLFAMILPNFIAEYTNLAASLITSSMLDGARLGAETGLVINVKISGGAAFLIESALVCVLLFAYKIPGNWKWAAFPAVSVFGIFFASFF